MRRTWPRTLAAAVGVLLCAVPALAQGYTVRGDDGPVPPRPAEATRLVFGAEPSDAWAHVTPPFALRVYGEPCDGLVVSAYGWVLPGADAPFAADPTPPRDAAGPRALPFAPGTGTPDGVVAAHWTSARATAWTWTEGDAPARRFVVAWEHAAEDAGRVRAFRVVFHEADGRVDVAREAAESAAASDDAALCGIDERAGGRAVVAAPVGAAPWTVFEPRTVRVDVPGLAREGAPVTWQDVRRESVVPDGCTRRCTYLARGLHVFHVPDRVLPPGRAGRERRAELAAEDAATFPRADATPGDPVRWVRQVLDGKILLVPAAGGAPQRVWFRIVEYYSLDAAGLTLTDRHTWNLRWMVGTALGRDDPHAAMETWSAWRAMARSRLSVGKLVRVGGDASDAQFDSGRANEYVLWSGRIRAGTRGALAPAETPDAGWRRFVFVEEDTKVTQHADAADLRFVPDPNYVDGGYEYVVATSANPFGWITGADVPAPPLRDEPFDTDPGRAAAETTPR